MGKASKRIPRPTLDRESRIYIWRRNMNTMCRVICPRQGTLQQAGERARINSTLWGIIYSGNICICMVYQSNPIDNNSVEITTHQVIVNNGIWFWRRRVSCIGSAEKSRNKSSGYTIKWWRPYHGIRMRVVHYGASALEG